MSRPTTVWGTIKHWLQERSLIRRREAYEKAQKDWAKLTGELEAHLVMIDFWKDQVALVSPHEDHWEFARVKEALLIEEEEKNLHLIKMKTFKKYLDKKESVFKDPEANWPKFFKLSPKSA
jgi:hypothetical protein